MKHKHILTITLLFAMIVCPQLQGEPAASGSEAKLKTVTLDIEEHLVIDSRSVDKNDPPMFAVAERTSDIFLLSYKPQLKIYRYNSDGKLLNSFLSQGEGPGEVKMLHNYQPIGDTVMASSYNKLVFFNLDGTVKEERKFGHSAYYAFFIDDKTYIAPTIKWDDSRKPISQIVLRNQKTDKQLSILCQRPDRRDLSVIILTKPRARFSNPWITPDFRYVYLKDTKQVVTALSEEKTLYLKDLTGKVLKSVTLDLDDIPFNDKEKAAFSESMERFKRRSPELFKELYKRIPDYFFPIMVLKPLPKNHFALFTPSGFEKYNTIKVFDQNLNLLYDLKLPKTMMEKFQDPRRINFFSKGFYLIDNTDDDNRYIEYHIKNLTPIFN